MNERDANTMTPGSTYTATYNTQQKIINAVMMPTLSLSGADPRPDSDYDSEQLKAGIEVEKEHSDDPAVASFIAKTHLDERKDYYEIVKREG